MSRLHSQSARVRVCLLSGVALVTSLLVSTVAIAGDLLPDDLLLPPEPGWTAVLAPVLEAPALVPAPPRVTTADSAPGELVVFQRLSPGLQFSLNPDDEEIVVGWQFGF